ncbi:uncharacterized protein LOC107624669 [Arachis ipaensis]|uniref:uncharacterized protein LOC107624669 n=1 Tax=Arachis ipaensis TaxID=130454 RepID=UPI0007AF7BE6|nr:uncharacterized protein LOC107624669 [Arachis ipaensis]XP_025678292.1 uncharacterized protein LOC112778154 [Arachis hypogaea]
MIIFSWNARGAASPNFTRVLKEYVSQYKPNLVAIQETRCSGTVAQKAIKKTGFNFNLVIDAQGFSGGIWLMWNNPNLSIQEISRNEQALHISVSYNLRKWFLTIVYANPNEERKRELRNYIANLVPTMNCPWMLCRDFNDISNISEKKGGAPPNLARIRCFRDCMDSCGFMDLGFQGTRFTWRGPIWQGRERVFKRLDKAISNPDWRICFQEACKRILLSKLKGIQNSPKYGRSEFLDNLEEDLNKELEETNSNRDCNLHTQTIYPTMKPGYMLKMKRVVEADEIEQAIFSMGLSRPLVKMDYQRDSIKLIGNW